jgi:hypothetical protein
MKVNMAMDGVGVMVAHGVVVTAVHGIIIMGDMVIITVVGAEDMEEDIIVFMVAAVVGATMEVVGVAFLGNTKRLILMLNFTIKHNTMC